METSAPFDEYDTITAKLNGKGIIWNQSLTIQLDLIRDHHRRCIRDQQVNISHIYINVLLFYHSYLYLMGQI